MEKLTPRESARLRKQRSRARLASQTGINRLEINFNDQELAMLDSGRERRNPGRTPYSRNEYLAMLILGDSKRLNAQEKAIPACGKCGSRPPAHCGGAFRGGGNCWLTIDALMLNLGVTGHGDND